jgi:ABC-2 type transport system ATP-binding protein
MTGEFAIAARNLRKLYGPRAAVAGLTLEVRPGEVFGFLGPNGAGKSTSLKMFLGLVRPTSGDAEVLGLPAGSMEARGRIGFLPEQFRFHDWLTADEFLAFHGSLYGLPPAVAAKRAGDLLERLGLAAHRTKRLREFSKGMLQRIGLAQALLSTPDLILLDEPTSGLDPGGRRLARDLILEQRRRGATVFVSSHLLSEIEVTCDRVAFLKHGTVLKTVDLEAAPHGPVALRATIRNLRTDDFAALDGLANDIRLEGGELTLQARDEACVPEIARRLAACCDLHSFTPARASLEEMFLEIIGPEAGL